MHARKHCDRLRCPPNHSEGTFHRELWVVQVHRPANHVSAVGELLPATHAFVAISNVCNQHLSIVVAAVARFTRGR